VCARDAEKKQNADEREVLLNALHWIEPGGQLNRRNTDSFMFTQ
jgi:hypothetical protein